jgi:RimJ/RimL family protein N-acetyltransferase
MAPMSLPTPTLHTARLRLRPFADADADALLALHSSAYVLRYWDAPPWGERARVSGGPQSAHLRVALFDMAALVRIALLI